MKKFIGTSVIIAAVSVVFTMTAGAQINATVYGDVSWNGSTEITFADPLFSFDTPAIDYGNGLPNALPYGGAPYAPGGYNWFPAIDLGYGPGSQYGVDFTGYLYAPTAGVYTVNVDSDDGTVLIVDGVDVQPNAFPQGPNTHPVDVTLNAGNNPFELQFFECCGGTAGVDLSLAGSGITYATPDSSEFIALTPVLLCAVHALRRKLKI